MSKLLYYRKKLNYTQDELSEKSGISVRTIQRIEAGAELKGHTLKTIASVLNVNPSELINTVKEDTNYNYSLIKLINISALLFFIPLANIVVPLLIIYFKKEKNPITKQIVSIQIIWLLISIFLFFTIQILQNALGLFQQLTFSVVMLCIFINIYIIIRNSIEIGKNNRLRIKLSYSII